MEILIDAKIKKSWILYLYSKDQFVDVFQKQLPTMEVQCNKAMQALYANDRREFILAKLKEYCNIKKIKIKYIGL